ncbi:protein SAWADEE HOMEODOMAIN HOMOLOG 1-like isoform X2 [Salvia miltiorrhiza]|uniref:protein SAWADEE HOMEODOMAIN HOMOLOG 1-like isoform X2 n=1 Tax=Salvia miltiorrhiza TaxID=226208 RepID=UPI0025AD24F5|nr:protein SAWADEE HOMEODOMAIN HOMOLOG 1-like isoform X2 [Salvia miltiorrhiza]
MDLRPRLRQSFSGFTKFEVQKMERLLDDYKEQTLEDEFCKKFARLLNRTSGRAGKPAVKWTESWFQENQQRGLCREASFGEAKKLPVAPETLTQNKATENAKMPEGVEDADFSMLEFEARSSKDGAWYDVDTFLSHRFLSSGEAELLLRYVGFGADEDEWVNARDSVRVRSVALEHTECQTVKVGDLVVCFQERQDQARYYDAHVLEIQRRWHDIRGCRCLFLIRYEHDNAEERVRLRRLCRRPTIMAKLK